MEHSGVVLISVYTAEVDKRGSRHELEVTTQCMCAKCKQFVMRGACGESLLNPITRRAYKDFFRGDRSVTGNRHGADVA